MNNDNKVETAIAGLNCWASYATATECPLFFFFNYSVVTETFECGQHTVCI